MVLNFKRIESLGTQARFRKSPRRLWLACGVPRSALRLNLGVSDAFRARPGATPKQFSAPKIAQDRIFMDFGRLSIDFALILAQFSHDLRALFSASSLLARCARSTDKAEKKRKTCWWRKRLAFGRSSLPTRLARSTAQLVSQHFTRSIMQAPPSY